VKAGQEPAVAGPERSAPGGRPASSSSLRRSPREGQQGGKR
jgi:hypothetical protein